MGGSAIEVSACTEVIQEHVLLHSFQRVIKSLVEEILFNLLHMYLLLDLAYKSFIVLKIDTTGISFVDHMF